MNIGNMLFCFKKFIFIEFTECKSCEGRRKCTSYQLYIQPDLPLVFRKKDVSVLENQDHPSKKLKKLSKKEFTRLRREARDRLSPHAGKREKIIRLKMYEMINGI